MTRADKFWLGYLTCWLVVGAGVGIKYVRDFPYIIYFVVPLSVVSSLGVVPASYALLFIRYRSWRARSLITGFYTVVLGMVGLAGPAYRAIHEAPAERGPYLTWAGDPKTGMTVSWTTAEPKWSLLHYGLENSSMFSMAIQPEATQFHHVTLNGLQPSKKYAYCVPDLGSTWYAFRTAPDDPEPYAFVVYGDTRPWYGLTYHRPVLRAIARADRTAHYRFIINTGDIVENPGEGYGWQWNLFLKHIRPLAATRPYLISLGNHEARGTTEYYTRYLDYGSNDFWYSFDYGNVHLVFLSTQHDLAPGSEQHQWLVNDLEARPSTTAFTAVCFHKPLVTYHPKERYKNDERRAALLPVLMGHGVDVVFTGHAHAYEHHVLNGLHHVVTGGGGVMLWDKPTAGPETVVTETCFHFCEVRVTQDAMTVLAHRLDGTLIEQFEIPRRL